MNTRILELVQNPALIEASDLSLLNKEISETPYAQSIRALYLYAVNKFDTENYKKQLTTTAAYTTDKKILYQFINGKPKEQTEAINIDDEVKIDNNQQLSTIQKPQPPAVQEKPITLKDRASSNFNVAKAPFPLPKAENKPVFVEGKQNRILFEGEENFMNESTNVKIDLESTKESGVIVTQRKTSPLNTTNVEEEIPNSSDISTHFEIQKEPTKDSKTYEEIPSEKEISENVTPEIVEMKVEDHQQEINEEESLNEEKQQILDDTPETIISEKNIKQESDIVENSTELSFHGLEDFLPEVTIQPSKVESQSFKPQQPAVNKHEEEMKLLIEEVERKMREKKKNAVSEDQTSSSIEKEEKSEEINFSETQSFNVETEEEITQEKPVATENSIDVETSPVGHEKPEEISQPTEIRSEWKPMSISNNAPDALISTNKGTEDVVKQQSDSHEVTSNEEPTDVAADNEKLNIEDEKTQTEVEALPVMNLSFFSSDISKISGDKGITEKPLEEEKNDEEDHTTEYQKLATSETVSLEENPEEASNIPSFINTWQSWLKIDRSEEILKEKTEIKNKAIDTFIENLPKISQLKDEVNFVVKEKTDDISHLMTETLANLYVEQKLYTKAIHAFAILIEKHPEKKEHFEARIKEIKESRGKY